MTGRNGQKVSDDDESVAELSAKLVAETCFRALHWSCASLVRNKQEYDGNG